MAHRLARVLTIVSLLGLFAHSLAYADTNQWTTNGPERPGVVSATLRARRNGDCGLF